jgi:Helix-turn-helix domain
MGNESIRAAVQRVDAIQISPDLARVIVHWLGQLAKVCERQNGCAPGELVAVQKALAEAYAGGGNWRQSESERLAEREFLISGHDETYVGTAEAAAWLGITANGVRWLCGQGHLESKKLGRQVMVTTSSIESYKQRKARIA